MRLLSTSSSSETQVRQPAPRIRTARFRVDWRFFTLVGIFLAAVNLLLGATAVQRILPQPNPYYEPGVETRRRALQQTLAEAGRIDVLFIGSSVVRTNFQPLTFDREINRQTGADIVSFNGGLSDMQPDPARLYLREFWLKQAAPAWVMQGIRYFELQNQTSAAQYPEFQGDTIEARWLRDTPAARLELLAFERLPLLYSRGILKDALKYFPLAPPAGFPIDGRGYNAPSLTLPQARSAGLLQAEPGYTSDYSPESFAFGLAALARTAAFCRENGITYLVVNIPEHGDKYLNQPAGRERYQAYLAQLQALSEAEGFVFIDVTGGQPERYGDDALFSDYHHMSPAGAERFTRELAQRMAAYLK